MEKVWDIKLYRTKRGWKVKIDGEGGKSQAEAATPHKAYLAAEMKLVVKPWLMSVDSLTK